MLHSDDTFFLKTVQMKMSFTVQIDCEVCYKVLAVFKIVVIVVCSSLYKPKKLPKSEIPFFKQNGGMLYYVNEVHSVHEVRDHTE